MARWSVFRSSENEWPGYPWVVLHVGHKIGFFRTWREAYSYADEQARTRSIRRLAELSRFVTTLVGDE